MTSNGSSSSATGTPLPVCNWYIEDLVAMEDIKITDPCPTCEHKIGYHQRRPATPAVISGPTSSSSKDGSRSILPKWKTDYKMVRPFLDRMEQVLTGDSVDRSYWPRLLLRALDNSDDARWVMNHIVEPKVTWSEARVLFNDHFEVFSYSEQLKRDYESIRQLKKETVQEYADRFLRLVEQLALKDDNSLVIQHFLAGLHREFYSEFMRVVDIAELVSGSNSSWNVNLGSLKAVINRAMKLESINIARGGHLAISTDTSNDRTTQRSNNSTKTCIYHPNLSNHTTAECRQNPAIKASSHSGANTGGVNVSASGTQAKTGNASVPSSSTKTGKDNRSVRCHACGNLGHYANDASCPKHSDRQLRQRPAATPTASTTSSITATTTTAPAVSSASGDKEARAVSVESTSSQALDRTLPCDVIIPRRREVMLLVKDRVYNTLVDTGASCSFMDVTLFKDLGYALIPAPPGTVVKLAHTGITVPRIGCARMDATVLYPHSDRNVLTITHEWEIMAVREDGKDYDFIIGRDLLPYVFPEGSTPHEYVLDGRERITQPQISAAVVEAATVDDATVTENGVRLSMRTPVDQEADFAIKRQQLLHAIAHVLSVNASVSGFCNVPEAQVRLEIDPAYEDKLWRRQYPIAETLKAAVTAIIERWYAEGKIVLAPPGCRYNNPICAVPKKDDNGTLTGVRPCLDVRALNAALVVQDRFPIPHIREALEQLGGNAIFSELDLQEAYLQFPLHPDSRPLTAFTWNGQQYMFAGCPYGLTLLTSHFQRVITRIFSDLTFCCPYVDNLPFAAKDWDTHTQQAIAIIDRCNQANLKIKPKFGNVGHSQLRCLGHVVSANGVSVDPEKMQAIQDWPLPATGKDLTSLLGLCSFVRQHVRHYADLTGPLEEIKSQDVLTHTDKTKHCFETLKQALIHAPILSFPDFEKPFHIATDASQTGVGGVLFQPNTTDEHITPTNIVAICSKKLTESQTRWPAYKKELFGVVYALRKFYTYVWGRSDLVVHTDHKPLTYIFSSVKLSPTLQQWLDVLLDYSFEIKHRDGILNIIPDTLSRMYGAAYEQSPIWGVDGHFPTSPIKLIERGEGSASSAVNTPTRAPSPAPSSQPSVSKDSIQCHSALIASDIDVKIELEKRGKTCPVTDEDKAALITKAHQFGHFGREAMFKSLWNQGYWWPGIRTDISNHLKDCDACTRYVVAKAGYHPSSAITAKGPADHIQIDTSIHLPESPDGHRALLVCIDVFTGFVILRPLKTTTAEVVANELWSIFAIIGWPKVLQSDNGPEFVNEVLRALVKLIGIEHRFITPYNPRADGKVERSIGTVMLIIKKLLNGTSNHWPLFVNFAQLTFNNKVSSLTGSTPFALMFGRSLNELKDYTTTPITSISMDDWKDHQEKILSLIYPAISDRISSGKNQLMQSLNVQRRQLLPTAFPNGSTVMIVDQTRGNKFEPKYVGPYTILRRSRGGAYVLKDMTGDLLDRRVTSDQMKLVRRGAREVDANKPIYEVDSVMDHRGESGHYEYLVHWKNYGEEDDSWEPAANFLDNKVIQDYWKKQQQS